MNKIPEVEFLKKLAAQLRCPHDDMGATVCEKMNTGNRFMYERVYEMLKLRPGQKVMEVGMANGAMIPSLFALEGDIQYTGCDFSDLAVNSCRQNNEELVRSGKLQLYKGALLDYDLNDAVFDYIFTINTLYFYEQPEKEFRKYYELLATGGRLIMAFRPRWVMDLLAVTAYGFKKYTTEQVVDLMLGSGLNIVSELYFDEPDIDMMGVATKSGSCYIVGEKPEHS